MEGVIFDIQKFALHDGPGIRTAVFLKGCPLSCVWCCNPESQRLKPGFSYNREKCSGCNKCIPLCPHECLRISEDKISVDFNSCPACGNCVDVCSGNALRIYGYYADTEDIITEVLKDKDYFDNSGGGLTLTGGEAMIQFDFAMKLMRTAKKRGLHTALETCGYAETTQFEQIMPYVDLFLFDYKHT
ncbi:MAG TPA: glycyl-radical enzyme activating protein, partial [Bacteroidales bacterium]|nr:glycyl-radical enzyme activating protein [Bacteroidales bacterium]